MFKVNNKGNQNVAQNLLKLFVFEFVQVILVCFVNLRL